MGSSSAHHGVPSRRTFLLGAAAGLAAGVPLTFLGQNAWRLAHEATPSFTGRTRENPRVTSGMPGAFPGRVIEVHHPGSVDDRYRINRDAVDAMVDRGMTDLVGADHPIEAWRRLFGPGDVVGLKVNPVGRKPKPGEGGRHPHAVGAISSPELLLKVVDGLKSAGVRPSDIIVFERYAQEFIDAGYDRVMTERSMDGVRWLASAPHYTNEQVAVSGFDFDRSGYSPELVKHVVGYDPDVFAHMGFCAAEHDPRDDRRFRSHLSLIVSKLVNKLVTLPVLKDHRSAGVTLSLKNMSHGMNSNVARSHATRVEHLDGTFSGPNQCNTFIPTAASQKPLRDKATLHILDGLIGVYEGGPGNWNHSWGVWPYRSLFFATDPVALDHVGWDILDAKRAEEGWAPVAHMGLMQETPAVTLSRRLAALAASGAGDALTLGAAVTNRESARGSESFDRRQPEHVVLAGLMGLGVFDARRIEHRRLELKA